MKEVELFKSIAVWHRVNGERAVLYECVESLKTGLFTVLVATSVRLNPDGPPLHTPTSFFVERFIEHDDATAEPDEKRQWSPTLAGAIETHRREFDDQYFAAAIPNYKKDFDYD